MDESNTVTGWHFGWVMGESVTEMAAQALLGAEDGVRRFLFAHLTPGLGN